MIKQTFRKSFSLQGWKNIINFFDEDGNWSWEQVWMTAIQIAFLVVLYLVSTWTGWDIGAILGGAQ